MPQRREPMLPLEKSCELAHAKSKSGEWVPLKRLRS